MLVLLALLAQTVSATPLRLAVKYVAYRDSHDVPFPSEGEARQLVEKANQVWSRCGISFTLEDYVAVRPDDFGLKYRTASYADLTAIRKAFRSERAFLIAATGPWDRKGPLGNTTANAWTSMPGKGPYGIILERPVGANSNLVAHELGHYLNLPHVDAGREAVMSPVIYPRSSELFGNECASARLSIASHWSKMLR